MLTSSDVTTEAEFGNYLPSGVAVNASRMHLPDGNVNTETLDEMAGDVERCAQLLDTANVDVIAYACTTGSLLKGPGYETEIENRIRENADASAVATAASIQRAFDTLGIDSIAITTPYIQSLNDREQEFLEASGYDVVAIDGLGLKTDEEIGRQPPEVAYRQALSVNTPEADAVFISCTGTRTFEIISRLEDDLGKPVITSNQATLWDALQHVDVDYSALDLGQLFRH